MVGELRMKKKNTKLDLIWIIPEIVGSVAIGVAAALHISKIQPYIVIGFMEWVFQIGLVMVVLGVGFKGIGHSCDELKEALHNSTQKGISK